MKTLFAIATLAIGAVVCTPIVMAQSNTCSSKAKVTAVAAESTTSSCSAKAEACPTSTAMRSLVKALYLMEEKGDEAGQADIRIALASLAEANPQIATKMSEQCSTSAKFMGLASAKPNLSVASVTTATCGTAKTATCSSSKAALAKNASQCSSSGANLTVANAASGCGKSKGNAANAALVSNDAAASSCNKSKGNAANAALVSNDAAGCGSAKAATCGSSKNAALASNTAAAGCCKSKGTAANAALVSNASTCSKSKTNASQVANAASGCCKSKGNAANAALVSNDAAGCSSAKAATCSSSKNAALASNTAAAGCCKSKGNAANAALASNTGCSQAAPAANAKFIAYGCNKSDAVARAAAQEYVKVLFEMKKANGADGCPMDIAQKTLAAVIADMGAKRTAQAADGNVQANLMVTGEACSEACKATCKKYGVDCSTTNKN